MTRAIEQDLPSSPARDRSGVGRPSRLLLKWAGGKRQLLPAFRLFYPGRFRRYYEPFLGSGAVFFDLRASARLEGRDVRLSDSNADLIGCYTIVRDAPGAVVAALARLSEEHARDGQRCYRSVRDRFNAARQRTGSRDEPVYTPALAAMLIYLNRTGYNGLFRVNSTGAFNVPPGRYARPRILDERLVADTSAALAGPGVRLSREAFDEAVADAGPEDFLYFDPPYAPVSLTSAFGAYTAARFGPEDQQRLCDTIVGLVGRGAFVMLSNSSAPFIETVYRRAVERESTLALWRVPARRAINSHPGRRGPVAELLLTNLPPRLEEMAPGELRRLA